MSNGMSLLVAAVVTLLTFLEDRQPIGMGDLVEPPPPTELTQIPVKIDDGKDQSNLSQRSSAKIDQLVHLLKLLPCNEKSLVFSQFTSFLDKVPSSDCSCIRAKAFL